MYVRPTPTICPARTVVTTAERDTRVQCQRPPSGNRPPWHLGPHRAEIAPPIARPGGLQGETVLEAQVITWD
jgi:hypothetical protein